MKVNKGLLECSDLTDKEFRALVALVLEADNQGVVTVSASKLAQLAQSDQRYAFRLLASLSNKGYLETVHPGNGRRPAQRKIASRVLK